MSLDEKRDEASAKYQTDKPDFCGVSKDEHEAFCAGWNAALAAAREAAPEFSREQADKEFMSGTHTYLDYNSRALWVIAAKWQHSQDRAALEKYRGKK